MKRRLSRLSRLLTLAAAGIACSNDADIAKSPDGAGGGSQTCTMGQTQTCVGSAACKGGQVCTAQGTWGACDCGAAGHAGSSGASGHGGGVGGQGGASGHGGTVTGQGGASGHGGNAAGQGGASGQGGNVAGQGGAAGHGAGAGGSPGGSGGGTPGTGGVAGSAGGSVGVGGAQGGSGGVAGSGGAAGGSSGTGGTGVAGGSGGTSTGQGGGGSSGAGAGAGGAAGSGGSSGGSSGSSGAAGTSGASGSPCASGGSSGAGGSGGSAEIPILPRCGDHTNNCAVGGPVDPMCNQCTALIAAGTQHCQIAWDASCVAATKNLSNYCTVCSDPCNDPLPHTPCEVGVNLPSCASNLCTSDVCQTDPTCCSSAWTASCAATAMADMNCATACAPPPAPVYDVTNGKLTLVDSQHGIVTGALADIIVDGPIDYAANGNFASTWVNEVGPRNSVHHQFAVDDTNFYVAVGGGAHKSAPKTGAIPKATTTDRIFIVGTTLYIASGSTIYSASVTGPNATVLDTADSVCADVVPSTCSGFAYGIDDMIVQDGYVFWYLRAGKLGGQNLHALVQTPLAGGPSKVIHNSPPVSFTNSEVYSLGTGPASEVYAIERQPGAFNFQVLRIDTAAGTATVLAQDLSSGAPVPPVADDTGVYLATIYGVTRVTACGATEDVILGKKDGCSYRFDNVTLFPQAIYFSLASVGCVQTNSLYRFAR